MMKYQKFSLGPNDGHPRHCRSTGRVVRAYGVGPAQRGKLAAPRTERIEGIHRHIGGPVRSVDTLGRLDSADPAPVCADEVKAQANGARVEHGPEGRHTRRRHDIASTRDYLTRLEAQRDNLQRALARIEEQAMRRTSPGTLSQAHGATVWTQGDCPSAAPAARKVWKTRTRWNFTFLPRSSSLGRWRYQVGASFLAWAVILVVGAKLDQVLGMPSCYLISVWLGSGIALMLIKGIDFPMPRCERVDVAGAFSMLWWSACWPRYLARR
jgi:hypothetical protein